MPCRSPSAAWRRDRRLEREKGDIRREKVVREKDRREGQTSEAEHIGEIEHERECHDGEETMKAQLGFSMHTTRERGRGNYPRDAELDERKEEKDRPSDRVRIERRPEELGIHGVGGRRWLKSMNANISAWLQHFS